MKLSATDFAIAPATHMISLGSRCAVAYNLRRFYNFRSAFPFDWWISSASGITELLRCPDIETLYDPSQLELGSRAETVRHRSLDIQLHHEFPRDATKPNGPVRPDWLQHLERPKARTAALFNKFVGLNKSGNRIAFFREQPDQDDPFTVHLDALFPNADYTLVFIPAINAGMGDSFNWKGNPALWDQTLAALEFSLDARNHLPFDADAKVIKEDHALKQA